MSRKTRRTATTQDDTEDTDTGDHFEKRPQPPPRPRLGTPEPIELRKLVPPKILGQVTVRGYGQMPHLSPEACAAFATYVDSARARAAIAGRTLIYTVRFQK